MSGQENDAILNLLGRFVNSFDVKQWDQLKGCLTENVSTDYSDFRGTPPETITAERFVELREKALAPLKTHHLAGNHEISAEGNRGEARVSMVIFRRDDSGKVFNTHCLYLFGLEKQGGAWKIKSIVQKVFWSDGDPHLHSGVKK
jgi:hypothetical protein